jgi:hypothetical protein
MTFQELDVGQVVAPADPDGAVIGRRNELLSGVRVWPGAELADGSVRFSSDG